MHRKCPSCGSIMYPEERDGKAYYYCSACNIRILRLSQVETVGGDSRDAKKNNPAKWKKGEDNKLPY